MSSPKPVPPAAPPAQIIPFRPAPAGLLYTILRHGRGHSHEEARLQQRQSLERGFTPAA